MNITGSTRQIERQNLRAVRYLLALIDAYGLMYDDRESERMALWRDAHAFASQATPTPVVESLKAVLRDTLSRSLFFTCSRHPCRLASAQQEATALIQRIRKPA